MTQETSDQRTISGSLPLRPLDEQSVGRVVETRGNKAVKKATEKREGGSKENKRRKRGTRDVCGGFLCPREREKGSTKRERESERAVFLRQEGTTFVLDSGCKKRQLFIRNSHLRPQQLLRLISSAGKIMEEKW